MKHLISLFILLMLILSITACVSEPVVQESASFSSQQISSVPEPTPTPAIVIFSPRDIFRKGFNPYSETAFPEYFRLTAASFSKGSAKLEGKTPFSLMLTAGGDMAAAVSFLADLAGLEEADKKARINEYLEGGFCEFYSADGTVVTIRETDPNDDRYEYVNGCLIEIQRYIEQAQVDKFTDIARDNYNLKVLSPIEGYIETDPDWNEFDFSVNEHKREIATSVVYKVSDPKGIKEDITGNVEAQWYDEENSSLGYSCGMIQISIKFDIEAGAVYITQTSADLDTAISEYVEPEVSLEKLGFGFDETLVCGVYEIREPHYVSIAIHRPEWGEFSEDWNIEYLNEINGYSIRITYHYNDRYNISLFKDGMEGKFDYYPGDGTITGEYPDPDTVERMFKDAFGADQEDYMSKPLDSFEQFLMDEFGLDMQEIYSLPIR